MLCLKLFVILMFVFSGNYVFADIISSVYSQPYNSLVSVVNDGDNKTHIIKTSLARCSDIEKILVDEQLDYAVLSKYVPTYLIGSSSKKPTLYSLHTGKAAWHWDSEFSDHIQGIYQDAYGQYVSVSDGTSVALFHFGKKGLEHIFTKEFVTGSVEAVQPDSYRQLLFVAESNGTITAWSFQGKLIKSINVNAPISSLALDTVTNGLIVGAESGIYFMPSDSYSLRLLLKTKVDKVYFDNLSKYIAIISGNIFSVYDYMSMKRIFSVPDSFGNVIGGSNRFIGLFVKNYITLFHLNSGLKTGVINISGKGSYFMPADTRIPGVNKSLMDMISDNKNNISVDYKKICAPIAAMVSGVNIPQMTSIHSPDSPKVNQANKTANPEKTSVSGFIDIPKIPDVSAPYMANTPSVSGSQGVSKPRYDSSVMKPAVPSVKPADKPSIISEMAPSSVPSWFANRKNLPPFDAVSGGENEDEAIKNAKKQIKNSIVKNILKTLVDNKQTAGINDVEVLKRFLWMTASSAANNLDSAISVKDSWKSPAGQIFVLCSFDSSLMKDAADKAYKAQSDKLSAIGYKGYMALPVNTID